jgi:hypothetical protein
VWRPFVEDALRVCVFRDPGTTATSIMKEADRMTQVRVTETKALSIWRSTYTHILERHAKVGEWIFIHFEQLLDGSALDRLDRALGVRTDRSSPDRTLVRSACKVEPDPSSKALYSVLCERAGFALSDR